jgi:hypothetical protein
MNSSRLQVLPDNNIVIVPFIDFFQATVIDHEDGRIDSDPAYNSVTKLFFSLKDKREEIK